MDERLEKALEHANYRITLSNQIENLKFKIKNKLTYAINGGVFEITSELISFVDLLVKRNITEAVLIDSKNNPVKISNVSEFSDEILEIYFEATNEFHAEYENIRRARSVKKLIGI